MRLLLMIPIVLAAIYADAFSYDVSIITVNKKPVIEIIINDRICQFPFTENVNTKKLVEECLLK